MKLTPSQITEYLEQSNIAHKWHGNKASYYHIASLFEPIDNGFFFLSNQDYQIPTKNSLILQNFEASDSINSYLICDSDPQQIYYGILDHYFKTSSNGIISSLTEINSKAKLGSNLQIDAFTKIGNCEIGNNCIIGSNSYIHDNTIIKDNTCIGPNSVIGATGVAWIWNKDQTEKIIQPQLGGVTIESNVFLGAQTVIVRGSLNEHSYIGRNTLAAPGCRIGHGTYIDQNVHLANNVVTGGNCKIGMDSFVGSAVVFRPKVNIHPSTIIGAGALVIKNTSAPGLTLMGVPAKEYQSKGNPRGMPKPKSK